MYEPYLPNDEHDTYIHRFYSYRRRAFLVSKPNTYPTSSWTKKQAIWRRSKCIRCRVEYEFFTPRKFGDGTSGGGASASDAEWNMNFSHEESSATGNLVTE